MASEDVLDRDEVKQKVRRLHHGGGIRLHAALLAHDAALRARVEELEEALEGLVSGVDDSSYKEGDMREALEGILCVLMMVGIGVGIGFMLWGAPPDSTPAYNPHPSKVSILRGAKNSCSTLVERLENVPVKWGWRYGPAQDSIGR